MGMLFMDIRRIDATMRELKDGFSFDNDAGIYSCLFCDATFEDGIVYEIGGRLADARKAAKLHIELEHGSVFGMLLSEDKKHTGLTDTQKDLLQSFYNGMSDKDIAKSTDISPSTVRYQRFSFREKAKQAKIILTLSELLEERLRQGGNELSEIHEGATMVDERYMTTDAEADKIVRSFFTSLTPPVLKSFSSKEKNKLVILRVISKQFESSKKYTEKQVNEVLKAIYDDYVTIRRYLIEYGFMDRTADCGEYWLR